MLFNALRDQGESNNVYLASACDRAASRLLNDQGGFWNGNSCHKFSLILQREPGNAKQSQDKAHVGMGDSFRLLEETGRGWELSVLTDETRTSLSVHKLWVPVKSNYNLR